MFKAGVVSKSAGGVAPDVTPNPTPNWIQDAADPLTNIQQISGISSQITLKISWDNTTSVVAVNVYKGVSGNIFHANVNNNGTFTVNPDDYIKYILDYDGLLWTANFTVTNTTDNNTILDTFTINYSD